MTDIDGSKYNIFDYMDLFVEEGYPLLQESLASVDAEDPNGESAKAGLVEGIGADMWGFFGCATCLIWLNALLKKDDMEMFNEIRRANLGGALEVYPDMERALEDFYAFLYENEGQDAEVDEEDLMEYLTIWLATNFFDRVEDEEFSEDEMDVAYTAAGTFGDFLKQVLLIQKEKFGPYVKEIDDIYLSGMFNLDDGPAAVN